MSRFSPKLQLGIELTGAISKDLNLGKGQLQTLAGGNYQVSQKLTFDFAILGGRYAASPRAGVQLEFQSISKQLTSILRGNRFSGGNYGEKEKE